MTRRNLYLVFAVVAVSTVCYQKANSSYRNRYGRLYDTFVQVLHEIDEHYVENIDQRDLFEGALNGMVGKLDEYSAYIDPKSYEELRESLDQKFGGIGIQVLLNPQKELTVVSPLVGTPAFAAGIRAGDRILEIDGQSTEGFTMQDAVSRLRGEPGQTVLLKVQHLGDKVPVELKVERAIINLETVLGDSRLPDGHWSFFLEERPGVGYVRLSGFGENTVDELKAALGWLKQRQMQALVLDLRNNPGGLLDAAVDICDLFIDNGVIVSTRGRGGSEMETYRASQGGGFGDFPMVVLVNQFSASASEIVSACLQDHRRAIVVGERTWGKGSVQNVIPLEDGKSALKLTIASYWRPSGKNIHRLKKDTDANEWGVKPNPGYEVPLTDEGIEKLLIQRRDRDVFKSGGTPPADTDTHALDRHDPQLEKAIEYLDQKLQKRAKPGNA